MKKKLVLFMILTMIVGFSCQKKQSSLKDSILTYITSIKSQDDELFKKVAINRSIAKKYLNNNELDKNSRLYKFLNYEGLNRKNSLEYIYKKFSDNNYKIDIDNIIPEFAIKGKEIGERKGMGDNMVIIYLSYGNKIVGLRTVYINYDNNNYFAVFGLEGSGNRTISEIKEEYKNYKSDELIFIDFNK